MNMGSEDVNEDLFGLEDEDFGEEINSRMNVTNISSGGSNRGGSGGRMFFSKKPRQIGPMDHIFTPNAKIVVQNRRSGKMNQTTINDAYKKEARERVCILITRWMYKAAIPFNAVTYSSFQPIIEAIGQYGVGMKGPTLHEGTMFMQSIDASSMIKTGEKMFELLDKWVEQVGEENVILVITDSLKLSPTFILDTMCCTFLDLMLEDIGKLPNIKRTLERAISLNGYSMTSGIRVRLRSGHSKGSMSGSNVEETSEQTRGREIEPTARGRGKKDKSRDAVANMEAMLAKQGMEKGLEDLREQIQDLHERVLVSQVQPVSHEEFVSFQGKVLSMLASMESRIEALELTIYKASCFVSARVMATHEASRVEVPKPHRFSGKRDAKELDNFLWHMERYQAIALTDEAAKVRTATSTFDTLLYGGVEGLPIWRKAFAP
ncbi:hypothetical protein AAG906_023620 [Vitis piasezkii]